LEVFISEYTNKLRSFFHNHHMCILLSILPLHLTVKILVNHTLLQLLTFRTIFIRLHSMTLYVCKFYTALVLILIHGKNHQIYLCHKWHGLWFNSQSQERTCMGHFIHPQTSANQWINLNLHLLLKNWTSLQGNKFFLHAKSS